MGFTPKAFEDGNYNVDFIQAAVNQCEHPFEAAQVVQGIAEIVCNQDDTGTINQMLANRMAYLNELVHAGIIQMSFSQKAAEWYGTLVLIQYG